MQIEFTAQEYHADDRFRPVRYRYRGSPDEGWEIARGGAPCIQLGPGYRALRVLACGVCSTDLARRFLPFPLPQITGHEVLAQDQAGTRQAVEINASHAARGLRTDCAYCNGGLHTHCPERLVLGIHDLPGGFAPWILAPVAATLPLTDDIPLASAVLVEPLAAALHAVETIAPRSGDTIAVLGPRKLGMLVIAAFDAYRRRHDLTLHLIAIGRHPHLLKLAEAAGADEVRRFTSDGDLPSTLADVVVETTGSPAGLETALATARREVHVKSTHGRPAGGLAHLTELVVDEIGLEAFDPTVAVERVPSSRERVIAWLADAPVPAEIDRHARVIRGPDAAAIARELTESAARARGRMERARTTLGRADMAVVDSAAQADAVIRPRTGSHESLVRPRGRILVHAHASSADPASLVGAILDRRLSVTTSRCGDFRAALALLRDDIKLQDIGTHLVTQELPSDDMNAVFSAARAPDCIKAVVRHHHPS